MNSLSTYTEVLMRGKIHEISLSTLRNNVYICIFKDGTQANIDTEVYYKLVGA